MNTAAAFEPLTKEDVADVLGVSVRTIENWVNDGTLPAPKRLGNRVYWHPGVFFGWLEHRLMDDEPKGAGQLMAPSVEAPAVVSAPGRRGGKRRSIDVDQLRTRDQAKLDALMA
ncbi:MAG: helix-turn-helix domain-containing protein [Burkholderiaceae bacterium]|nr:helix-turn-helix domain-containing protein [Burkholderiaceae bacterium]